MTMNLAYWYMIFFEKILTEKIYIVMKIFDNY